MSRPLRAAVCSIVGAWSFGSADEIDFPSQIAPIFARHCLECHRDNRRNGEILLQTALGAPWYELVRLLPYPWEVRRRGTSLRGGEGPRTLPGNSHSPVSDPPRGDGVERCATISRERARVRWSSLGQAVHDTRPHAAFSTFAAFDSREYCRTIAGLLWHSQHSRRCPCGIRRRDSQ